MPEPSQPARVQQTDSRWQRWSVLLPALTFLVGGALGAAAVGAFGQDVDQVAAPSASSPATSAGPEPTATGLVVRVPEPCLQAAEQADDAYSVLDRAVTAVRDLDARRLQELVDQAQDQQARARTLVDACRQQAADALTRPATPPSR